MTQIVGPVQVARRSDMDMNGHINNVTYLAWAQETVPKEVFQNYVLDQVEHQAAAARPNTRIQHDYLQCCMYLSGGDGV